jgi:transcriptional regulator GlxA family with amidase domain
MNFRMTSSLPPDVGRPMGGSFGIPGGCDQMADTTSYVGVYAIRRSCHPDRPAEEGALIDVTVLFLERGHASTAAGPLEVFRAAGVLWNVLRGEPGEPHFRVRSASIGGRPVRPDAPYTIQPDLALEDVGTTDLVFVPSAGLGLDELLARNAPAIDFLRRARTGGARIAAVCSGVALPAAAGILDGRRATTHWALVDAYRERFPAVDWCPEEFVTESDGIYCGGGVYASLDLSLYLVEKLCGRTVAVQCSRSLLIEMPRACQAGFAVLPMGRRHADEAIRRAEEWIHRHCRTEFRFEGLARELGMSPRNFIRRFKAATGLAPVDYLQRLRVRAAQRLLEEEHSNVQEVSRAVGYEDAAFFRSLFKRHTGLSPGVYRRKFAAEVDSAS